MVHHESNPQI
jgi:hypothetical protein